MNREKCKVEQRAEKGALATIIEQDICIGCGICAALCPDNVLGMRFNEFGGYAPVGIEGCQRECGLCLKVCPFWSRNDDEDAIGRQLYGDVPGIHHRSETGYHLSSYVCASNLDKHRERGASGGMATYILETMLDKGVVDAVACVTPNPDPERLFKFEMCRTIEEVRASSGSAYYPVELSAVIRHILTNPGRYALIGLPCFVKAIRLAQQHNEILRNRITAILGLVCNQLMSKHYAAHLAALAGLEGKPHEVHFRGKDPEKPANNYYFSARDENDKEVQIYWEDGVSEVWQSRAFTPNACSFCDDVFAECADVTLMDAWLPEYSRDPRGTNLVIVRSPFIAGILKEAIERNDIEAQEIQLDRIVRSQAGALKVKRQHLAYRLHMAERTGATPPRKRVRQKGAVNPFLRWEIDLQERMRALTRSFVSQTDYYSTIRSREFQRSMEKYTDEMSRLRRVSYLLSMPGRAVRRIRGGYL